MKFRHADMLVAFPASPVTAQAQATASDQSEAAEAARPMVGGLEITSDYRFRGVSQSDRAMAVRGGMTVSHASGLYAGVRGSNLAGWGPFGGANLELDLIRGYKTKLADTATLDVGLTWYLYPGGADRTDFAEPYVKLTGTTGPAPLTAGITYAPKQQAIGRWYDSGMDAANGVYTNPGDIDDNLYVSGGGALALAGTPITAEAHVGHSRGQDGLGPNATAVAPTGACWDWSFGADATCGNLNFNVSDVDTDIANREATYLRPGFGKGRDGTGSIAGGTIVAALTAAF